MNGLSYHEHSELAVIDQLSKNPKLTEWEVKFMKSIKEYSDRGGFLSDKQKQKLSDLWEKY